jgi:hypothetical protein
MRIDAALCEIKRRTRNGEIQWGDPGHIGFYYEAEVEGRMVRVHDNGKVVIASVDGNGQWKYESKAVKDLYKTIREVRRPDWVDEWAEGVSSLD